MAGWLVSHVWKVGRSAGKLEQQIQSFIVDARDIKTRLGRIEKLLMEGRR